jgi:predicted MFS family arabinose efflux permease
MLGAGGIVGALAAPALQRRLSPYASIAGVFWVLTVLTPVAAVAHSGYALGALFAAMALLPPTANTTIMTRQLLLTPDELRGRLAAGIGLAVGVAAALGPVAGGLLVAAAPGSAAVLVCAAGIAAVTLAVTISPTLRAFPRDTVVTEAAVVS